ERFVHSSGRIIVVFALMAFRVIWHKGRKPDFRCARNQSVSISEKRPFGPKAN
ncbi:MAG: hypothetical protein ACI9TA_003389, partial [Reinekea sp.]